MKKHILILFIFFSSYGYSQELMNYYLSPEAISGNTEGTVLMLHTTFFYYSGAGLVDYNYTIEDNVINFKMCYALSSSAVVTIDKKVFEIVLPTETGNYIFNMEMYTDYNGENCLYENIAESGNINFSLPYTPTEKIDIDDTAFESYLEYLNYGDDEFGNGWVYKHRIDNIKSIHFRNEFEIEGEIESLNSINHFQKLKRISIFNEAITILNFEENSELEWVFSDSGTTESLVVTNNPNLKFLWCPSNILNSLDISNNPLLEDLNIGSDFITDIDLSDKYYLKNLHLRTSQLTSLDLTNNILLERLTVNSTQLTSLDLSNNQQLYYLVIGGNEFLNELDVSTLSNLYDFYCTENSIESLDLSLNQNLSTLILYFNNLNYLNIKNGNNEEIYQINTIFNPNLFCIEVDNEDDPQPFDYSIDEETEFSEDCSTPLPSPLLGVNNKSLQEISLYPNPVNDILNITLTNLSIKEVKIFNLQGKLIIEETTNKKVDVSGLVTGMYFVKIESEENSVTKKFVKL
jgi:hypothetical protein